MVGFQQPGTLLPQMGAGVPGEAAYDGPMRAFPWTLVSYPQPNVVGATAYTVVSDGVAMAGGTGQFAGLLVNPKVYAAMGTGIGAAALAPTMTLPDNTVAELMTMGFLNVVLTTAANIGDLITYNTTTGTLSSVARNTVFTASSAGTVLTVTGTPIGFVGPGLNLPAPFSPGTQIISNGTGSGGAGTYNINNSQTVASGTYTVGASGVIAPSGQLIIPHCKTILRASAAGGLAILEMTE